MHTYADETYLVVPAANVMCCWNSPYWKLGERKQLTAQLQLVGRNRLRVATKPMSRRNSSPGSTLYRACRIDQGTWFDDQPKIRRHTACWQSSGVLCANALRSAHSETARPAHVLLVLSTRRLFTYLLTVKVIPGVMRDDLLSDTE